MNLKPPRVAEWLLERITDRAIRDSALGDFAEQYGFIADHDGRSRASTWYWIQLIRAIPLFVSDKIYWSAAMFKNYLKVAVRNLYKQKIYSTINFLGLAIGLAGCILILLYVRYEFSYDRFHENRDRVYRVERKSEQRGSARYLATTPVPLAPAMRREVPGLLSAVRLLPRSLLVRQGDLAFVEERFFFADSTFFEIFSFHLINGNPQTALNKPNSIVLTAEMAKKYFGKKEALGQTLIIENGPVYQVTGVLAPVPKNTHFHFDFLASFTSLRIDESQKWRWLNQNIYYTYVLTNAAVDPNQIASKIDALYQKYVGEEMASIGWNLKNALMPLTRINLHSKAEWEIEPTGDATTVAVLAAIAVMILVIACVNFVNLSTARAARRAGEIGLRKVLGAYRISLIKQFLGESILLSVLSALAACGLIFLFLPLLNRLVDFQEVLAYGNTLMPIVAFVALTVLVGFVAGSYPAFLLAGFEPVGAFKGVHKAGLLGTVLRKGLVVFQFVVSLVLIIGTAIMVLQLEFVRNKRLGFDKEQMLVLPVQDASFRDKYESFKNELLEHEGVTAATACHQMPGGRLGTNTFRPEGVPQNALPSMKTLYADHDFVETLGLEIVSGRAFSRDFATDATEGFILNQAAVNILGWLDPVGKQFGWSNRTGRVIGVVRDFHFASLHQPIAPLVILIYPNMFQSLGVRVRPENFPATLSFIEEKWQRHVPGRPFDYAFLDDEFDQLYRAEERLKQIWTTFAGLAILVACLGLFGLAAFTAEQRTKEIGIRKVLGASATGVTILLSREFANLVLISFIIGAPMAYLFMDQWLQDFAYRIEMSPTPFLFAGSLTLAIALATVSFQAIRAALSNPVDSLRTE